MLVRSSLARVARACAWIFAGVLLAFTSYAALADPPARVARLSFVAGRASFSPAGDPDNWVEARLNRPVFIGDRVWSDRGSRLELELGTAALRAGEFTSIAVLNLDDRATQLEVTGGRLDLRVRSLASDETFEVDTPNLAFVITRPGNYRVEVDSNGNSTVVAIRDGRGEVYGEGNSYVVDRGQWYRFYGAALDNDYARIPPLDDLDRWAFARETRHERSPSARYVSRAVIGYDDLDEYGTWSVVPEYGNVWIPRNVSADWAPYRDGHWAWIEPWGWTWVDDAPWGFAPFHYGRWAFVDARWCWVPGPANVRPIYAPALVAFVGGNDLTVNVSSGSVRGVAWFPLAPGEVYRPPYRVTRNYFTEINVTNTRVNNAFVTSIYNSPNAGRDMRYRHRELPAAVTAVAVNAFVESRPVARAALPRNVVAEVVQRAPVLPAPAVAPARASVIGAARSAPSRPPAPMADRHVVARALPPAAPPTYAPHELNVNPGNVVDANPRPPALRDRVRVVTPAQPVMSGAAAQHRAVPNAPAAATPPAPAATPPAAPAATPPAAPTTPPARSAPPPLPHAGAVPPAPVAPHPPAAPAAIPAPPENGAAQPPAPRRVPPSYAPMGMRPDARPAAPPMSAPPATAPLPAPAVVPAPEAPHGARPEMQRMPGTHPAAPPVVQPSAAPPVVQPPAAPPVAQPPAAPPAAPMMDAGRAAAATRAPAPAHPPAAAPAPVKPAEPVQAPPAAPAARPAGDAHGAPPAPPPRVPNERGERQKGRHGDDGNEARGRER